MDMNWENDTSGPLNREQQIEEDGLKALMRATAPVEPHEAVWSHMLAQVEQRLQSSRAQPTTSRWPWLAGGAAAAAVLLGAWLLQSFRSTPVLDEPFPVATAAEIEILSVNGADTHTLVVGNPPVEGALELLGPGDVTLFSVEAAPDEMVPEIRFHGPNSPMIWAHLDHENE